MSNIDTITLSGLVSAPIFPADVKADLQGLQVKLQGKDTSVIANYLSLVSLKTQALARTCLIINGRVAREYLDA